METMNGYTTHIDKFVRDALPSIKAWPTLDFELLDCVTGEE